MTQSELDSVTVDIIGHHLVAISEEMGVAMMRAAYSPNIKERRDCTTALLDTSGHSIAQAEHIPIHMGSMIGFIPGIVAQYDGDIHPGDIFISNDPYLGGSTHLPDVSVVAPLHVAGELVGFAAAVAHHAEFGGSLGVAPDIYSEGLRLPILKIVDRGVLDEALIRLIQLNTRVPTERLGDLRSQFAAVSLGVRRYDALLARYGPGAVVEATHVWLDKAEAQARAALQEMPKGRFEFADRMDSDGAGTVDIPIRVAIEIDDERIAVDFTGTAGQVAGQINTARAAVEASVYYTIKTILDPTLPANAGFYRIVEITIPRGSLLNSVAPAPVFMRSDSCQRAVDAILGAFSQALPDRIPAASNGSITAMAFNGYDATRQRPFAYTEVIAGGAGALPTADGQDAVQTHITNTANTPVEAVEQSYPLRVTKYALRDGSGGAGRFRGGIGIIRELETLNDDIRLLVKGDRVNNGPWGLQGGGSGLPLAFVLDPESDHPRTFTRSDNGTPLRPGTIVRAMTAGGGGFGSPQTEDETGTDKEKGDAK
ncbi:hydantoinase B/oxoprolinase family protein [Amycolatopsis pithecellobii]|uniref:Hydantoinase B/oxoprolinase family protein n=1 Tax=Amycolatopsis pithecellobii TaxID=664692 RepID=A0A6N7YK19_9PSEU|nr:hydantoinase B/oxoprolinase family protein [Amycolatopsis pithecellobii]MTD53237.1 hydantoinase B/oxoprolinase family protein [Amycolatopsis pithecellobii]